MKLYSYLTEALNNPYKYHKISNSIYAFKAKSGTIKVYIEKDIPHLKIHKNFKSDDIVYVAFTLSSGEDEPTSNLTGTGDAFRIFATVKKIILDYVNKHKPKTFYFSSVIEDRSRLKLYDRFAKEIDKTTKYKYIHTEEVKDSSFKNYHFVREDLLDEI